MPVIERWITRRGIIFCVCDIKSSFFGCAKFKMTLRQINGNVQETSSCMNLEFRREIKTAKKRKKRGALSA